MIILKNFLKEIVSIFVFIRFKNIQELYEYLCKKNKKSGILATIFNYYCRKHGSFIGIGAKFKNWPHFPHGIFSVFISDRTIMGENCVIMQQTTIGNVTTRGSKNIGSPVIGDNCYISAGAKIVGKVHVGNNVRVGANAVVFKDIPDNSVVVGNNIVYQKDEPLDNSFYILNDDTSMFKYDFETRSFKKVDI